MSSTNTREDTQCATISVTSFTAGKRSRSNSSSSSSSTSSGSVSGSSVFSRLHTTRSKDGSSSCSSPYSSKTSPASSSSDYSDDERPSKSLRVSERSIGPVQAYPSPSAETVEDAALATLKNKCSLQQSSAVSIQTFGSTPSPVNDSATAGGKSLFVDCLVDATVHVLDMIWHAPVKKSVAFLQNVRSASSISTGEISRPCQCPVGAPFTGGIPLDLFIRETLRRSRTSCSTLQAALLYCKRVGAEAIRKRAEREEVELSDDEHKALDGRARAYPSLSKSEGQDLSEQLSPRPAVDPILCSRRTFLAAVMISSKFLQDRTFSNRAWSKISGLSVKELGVVERRMLDAIEFDLYVGDDEWLSWTNYLKGDWKSGIDSCRCLSESPPPTSQKSIEPRKALERTSSLHVNETLDLEACAAPPMRHATTCDSIGSSLSHNVDSNLSTPTQTPHNEDIGQVTPTKHGAHKREPALLPIAISNNISGMRKSVVLTNEVPTPFPLRKGLASRSMSTQ